MQYSIANSIFFTGADCSTGGATLTSMTKIKVIISTINNKLKIQINVTKARVNAGNQIHEILEERSDVSYF